MSLERQHEIILRLEIRVRSLDKSTKILHPSNALLKVLRHFQLQQPLACFCSWLISVSMMMMLSMILATLFFCLLTHRQAFVSE